MYIQQKEEGKIISPSFFIFILTAVNITDNIRVRNKNKLKKGLAKGEIRNYG